MVKTFLLTKKVGSPWESFSVTAGREAQILRTRLRCSPSSEEERCEGHEAPPERQFRRISAYLKFGTSHNKRGEEVQGVGQSRGRGDQLCHLLMNEIVSREETSPPIREDSRSRRARSCPVDGTEEEVGG